MSRLFLFAAGQPGLSGRPRLWYGFSTKNQILRLTATQAARDFSGLLDQVENGSEAVIERRGEAIALIGPAGSAPRRISECLSVKLPRASVRPDPDFARDLDAIIAGNPKGEPPAWD